MDDNYFKAADRPTMRSINGQAKSLMNILCIAYKQMNINVLCTAYNTLYWI